MCQPCPLSETIKRKLFSIAVGLLISNAVFCPQVLAATLEIPLALDYRILEQALREQVFPGPEATAEVFADQIRCNILVLSEPSIAATDDGQVRILASMQARFGTPIAGKCWFAKSWQGLIETLQTAHIDPERSTVSFKIVDSTILRSSGQHDLIPRFMRNWITDYVHPRLGAVKIDLGPAVSGIQDLLVNITADTPAGAQTGPPNLLSSLQLADVRITAESLVALLSLDVADAAVVWAPAVEAPLNDEELAQWDAAWQTWDGFATWLIKTIATSARPALTDALAETLLEARYDLRDALARDDHDRDPVRALFLKTWDQLAPLLHEVQLDMPGSQAFQYASFISAGDALRAMDSLAPQLGMRLDRDSLRSLARILAPGVSDYELRYDAAVDPELRALLGLEPEFEEASVPLSFFSWLIRSADASQVDPKLAKQLNNWVPTRQEIDSYLQLMEQFLNAIAQTEHDKGKVPAAYFDIYDTLLLATAFQESCWRQYIEKEGTVQTIRSSAGSVGLMQINVHVWRGIYDLDALTTNIGYNVRAGNEILVHYLVDYAIRKKEHEISGEPDSLARATYAVYNGGPRHLTRYRDASASASLKYLDNVFWRKYRAIQNEGSKAVKQCLLG